LDVTAVLNYRGRDPQLLAVKDKIAGLVQMKDTAPLTPRYEPDEFSVRDPEVVTTAVAHYLKALEMQAKAKNMSAIFAGKQPHQSSIVVGGVTMLPDANRIAEFRSRLLEQIDFIKNVYLPDVLYFGTGPLLPLARAGIGGGYGNFLAYGGFDLTADGSKKFFEPGVIFHGQIDQVQPLDPAKITEAVHYSWYAEEIGTRHPSEGEVKYDLEKPEAYSFLKAPRYDGEPMEVGPLARMLIKKPAPLMKIIAEYGIKPGVVARHAARAVETALLADAMLEWVDELADLFASGRGQIHDTAHWEPPKSSTGVGLTEAPRGALGHWIKVEDHKIARYQLVVPSTWNLGPRDEQGKRGPVEEALIGTPVPDPENPINVVRVIRSFDPCLACAVHLIEPKSNRVLKFRVI
ncbi:MAG: nickel-dependent hydrogenase large subunit, partial [Bacillota bacterium]|nr:nickel-dependent hydrogenase large subunit [Bacillota bacterium]